MCLCNADQRQDWLQRHGEVCLSEQYVKCALPACLVLVLVGYTDPSRPFQVNDETILCRKALDAATGSAAPALRYFCSQAHCEEDKRDHEVTMKEYISELARKEGELKRIEEELNADYGHFNNQMADRNQKQDELNEDLRRERESHELKLSELKSEVHKTKRPLKEMGEIVKRETANLEQLFKKKTLEIQREMVGLSLLQSREMDRLNSRKSNLHEEKEVFYREKYAAVETALQQLLRLREDKELVHNNLRDTREGILMLEERQLAMGKELDAINAQLSSNDKDTATSTATTSAADPGPMKMPTEQPEHLKATPSSKKGTKEERSGKIDPSTELARKESELKRKQEEHDEELEILTKEGVEWQQKRDELNEDLKRERQNHELKLRELKADLYTSKMPLKEMGEVMKRETANLQRIFRSKELESKREVGGIYLLQFRRWESLDVQKIGLDEEREALVREKYAGDKTVLHQQLLKLRESDVRSHKCLLQARESILMLEERQLSLSKELDAINAKIGSNDKDTAAATTSAAYSGPVKTPSEHAPADTLRSTSVTDKPPSTSPLSGCQKVISPLEEKMKEEQERKVKKEADERKAAFEELVREKQANLKRKMDVIASVDRKMEETRQKLRDMGALSADGTDIRTDLTEEKKLVVDPIAVTFLKCRKLKRSLTRDHDIKKCELDIEIAKLPTLALEEIVTVLIRKIDNKIEMLLTEGGRDVERDEEQVRVYQDDLVKLQHEIDESNSRCALLEKRLLELVAEGEGDALVPATKPPPHAPTPPPAKDMCKVDDRQLFNAAAKGNLGEVQKLLAQGANKDGVDDEGCTPLYIAAANGHLEVVQYLLKHEANKDKASNNGCSPLFMAAQEGHLAVVQYLREQGADKDKVMDLGASPLYVAAQNDHVTVVRYLLEQGADKDKASKECASPLFVAAEYGHLTVVQYLLEHGADKDKADNHGCSPLFVAAQNGQLPVVEFLVEQGADKDKANNKGASPLFIAAFNGYLAVVQFLIEQGADKDKANNDGASPLYVAAQEGQLAVVQCLLKQGADKDKAINNGSTLLFVAAMNGHLAVIQHLLEQGADKEKARIDNGAIPFLIAASEGHLAVVRYLLEHGADKDKTTNVGLNSLYIAAQNGHLAVVRYLLKQGVDKNKSLNNGASPLFIAAESGHTTVVQCLLQHGVDQNKAMNNGITPLHAAAEEGHLGVVQYLLRQGADMSKATNDGRRLLDVAANEEIKKLIRDEDKRRKKHKPN